MMKSFFKKLSLVMALAMVVSLVAPAGSAFAAEAGIAHQGTKTVVTAVNVEVGEEVADFCFLGAPADWKSTFKWASSDETVATVDKAGKVTALKDGVATITITAGADASYKHSVEVTVGKGNVDLKAFEVDQLSTNVVKLVFAESKNVTVDNLVFGTLYGDTYIEQPVKSVNVNNNEAVVTLYTTLLDGGKYNFTFDGYTAELVASAGEIFSVNFEYWTDKYGDGNAFVPENDSDDTATTLVAHYYDAQGVDVTALYPDVEVAYELIAENEAVDLIDNTVTFTEPTVAQIMLTVSWMDEEGEDVVREYPGIVVAKNRPALSFTVLGAGVFNSWWWDAEPDKARESFLTDGDGYVWSNWGYTSEFIDGDGQPDDLVFAAALKDNRGNTLATGDDTYPYGEFVFESTNDKVIAVEEDGSLTVVGEGRANIIVSFLPNDVEEGEAEKIYVAFKTLTVKPARYAVSYKLASTTNKAATDGSARWGSFILGAFDQYGDLIALENGAADLAVVASSSKNEVELEFENANGWCGALGKSGDYYVMNYDGDQFASMIGNDKYGTYKYKITLDKEENDTITTSANASVTLKVYNTDAYYTKLTSDTATTFAYGPWADPTSVDLAVNNIANYKFTKKHDAQKTVSVGVNYLDPTSDLNMAAVTDMVEKVDGQTTGDAGVIYFSVSAPKSANDNWGYKEDNGQIKLTFNSINEVDKNGNPVNDGFGYASTGIYKVTLQYASKDGGTLKSLTTYNINVSNSQSGVSFKKFDDTLGNETATDIDATWRDDNDADVATVMALVKENMKFSADSKYITDVTFKAYSSKVYIKKVTFELPLDDRNAETDYTVTKTVTVNKYIYEGAEE
ncbi:MAG: Ig-like domain-containing protein [Lachnospiraceae bacterium]|nr:Ig-like domain-containing protein [Lachnospiraceae bacterium]